MMLELHNVTIGQQIQHLSLTVNDGELLTISGSKGSGKTTLLRAILGFLPLDEGHISIDGELLTPQSAPYFRRQIAYVPQQLSMPDGCRLEGFERWAQMPAEERYLFILIRAMQSKKSLVLVDEPAVDLTIENAMLVDQILRDAPKQGMTILAVNDRIDDNQVKL